MGMELFDVVCSTPFVFNEDVFEFWIDGLPGNIRISDSTIHVSYRSFSGVFPLLIHIFDLGISNS